MKRTNTSPRQPDRAALVAALAAAPEAPAPDPQNPATKPDEWADALVSHSLTELREGLAARRARGKGKRPAKTLVSLRITPEALARWRASGPGWQTRAAAMLAASAP